MDLSDLGTDAPGAIYLEKIRRDIKDYADWWENEYIRILGEIEAERKDNASITSEGFEVENITREIEEEKRKDQKQKNEKENS